MGYFLIGLIWCIIWGVVVNEVIKNKGYQENWFVWGFFFGFFALIVALTKQNVPESHNPAVADPYIGPANTPEMQLSEITFRKIDINAPIHIIEWNIAKEDSFNYTISIDFFNLSKKAITAVLFKATGLNTFGDAVLVDGKESFDILQQDLFIEPGKHCNIKSILPNRDIRNVQLNVNKVCFTDGEIEPEQSSRWVETKQLAIDPQYIDCVKRENPSGAYFAIIEDDYWQCTCGFVNVGHTCLTCGMSKPNACNFTTERIIDTYQKYLSLNEAETAAAKEKAEEDTIKAMQAKKICITRWIIAGCIAVLSISVFTGISHMQKRKEYHIEVLQIEDYIQNENYDAAFSIMISSRSYDKLSISYGNLLWQEQIKLDESFCPNALKPGSEQYAVFEAERSRGNMCFSYELGKNNSGRYAYVYALCSGEGRSLELLRKQCYSSDEYIFISGLGGTDDEDNYALWSNGWLFLSSTINYKATYYAIKYDKSQDKAIVVVLPDGVKKATHFYKMKDGNIVMSNGPRVVADTLWIFDVVNGSAREVSHGQYAKIYGNIIEQDKNTLYQKNTKYEGLHFDH